MTHRPFMALKRGVYSCAGDLPLATAGADDDDLRPVLYYNYACSAFVFPPLENR
jgi:hypothetical protein